MNFRQLFSLLFSLFAPLKSKFTAYLRKNGGKIKSGEKKFLFIRVKES